MRKLSYIYNNSRKSLVFAGKIKFFLLSFLVILPIITVLFQSCSPIPENQKISEGEIEYNIEYLDNEKDNPMILLLPNKMKTSFKNNSSRTLIEGFGIFKLIYISDSLNQTNYTLFQMMDKKYYSQTEENRLSFGFEDMEKIKIKFSNKEKKIAGYTCKLAIASFPDKQFGDIEVYYTKEIKLNNPNRNNPFHEIKGVLMEFTVNLMGINMRIKTKKVTNKKIKPEIFEIPNGFNKVAPEEMEKIVNDYNLKMDK
jgi:GLPGLI family protein